VNITNATSDKATIEVEPNDLHHLIGAMHTLISQHRNLAGSPYGLRLQDTLDGLRAAEKAIHDQDARARGLTVEGDEPFVGGGF
jgi:hypothetical protein